ncbi:hypothetical protein MC885_016889 [Smutsia gigantea]|nr:hypothetical protein MC885_016889 [Smutsia gigantea]
MRAQFSGCHSWLGLTQWKVKEAPGTVFLDVAPTERVWDGFSSCLVQQELSVGLHVACGATEHLKAYFLGLGQRGKGSLTLSYYSDKFIKPSSQMQAGDDEKNQRTITVNPAHMGKAFKVMNELRRYFSYFVYALLAGTCSVTLIRD